MLIVALVFAGLAAALHVYIFFIESIAFEKPSTLKVFGITAADAVIMKRWAYNQGFYNLFLAIGTAAGLGLVGPNRDAGLALIIFTMASMLTAAMVLVSNDVSRLRGAVIQGTFPALALLALGIGAIN